MNDTLYFYTGSCRYQALFKNHFPPRIHNIKSFLHLFNNINNFNYYFDHPKFNLLYGDALHRSVINQTINFKNNLHDMLKNSKFFVIEYCSNKIKYNNEIPLVDSYTNEKIAGKSISFSTNEIENDLNTLNNLLKTNFGATHLIVIPHLSIKITEDTFIEDRQIFVQNLENICKKLDILFIDIHNAFPNNFLGDVMPDGTHYTQKTSVIAFNYIKKWLKQNDLPDI